MDFNIVMYLWLWDHCLCEYRFWSTFSVNG